MQTKVTPARQEGPDSLNKTDQGLGEPLMATDANKNQFVGSFTSSMDGILLESPLFGFYEAHDTDRTKRLNLKMVFHHNRDLEFQITSAANPSMPYLERYVFDDVVGAKIDKVDDAEL